MRDRVWRLTTEPTGTLASFPQTGAPVLVNVTFRKNKARYGAGLLTSDGSGLLCVGCIIKENVAEQFGGGVLGGGAENTPIFINSIIANNTSFIDVRAAPSHVLP